MRNLLLLFLVFSAYSASSQIAFNTGNAQLDSDLNALNLSAKSDLGAFKTDMKLSYNVSDKKFDYMRVTLKMAPGEIYLALEIAKIAKKPVDDVLKVYKTDKSKGWGYIAKQLGIKPGSAEFHQLKNNTKAKKDKSANKKQPQHKGNGKKK